jgi:hypothetical protein
VSNVRVTAGIRYAWTALSFPSDLGLIAGPDYNEPCVMRRFNSKSEQTSGFLEDFRVDVEYSRSAAR